MMLALADALAALDSLNLARFPEAATRAASGLLSVQEAEVEVYRLTSAPVPQHARHPQLLVEREAA
jgi:hypothetical protein